MNERDGFLAAIRANPDDDTLRLIYADWLEERGDPRGEFIRVQIALEESDLDSARAKDLKVREHSLLSRHQDEWLGAIRPLLEGWQFRRGFLHELRVHGRAFLEQAEQLFAHGPVRRLVLTGAHLLLKELASRPELSQVAELHFHSFINFGAIGDDRIALLADAPYLRNLESLNLEHNDLGTAAIRTLADSPGLVNLAELRLTGNPIGDLGLQALLATPHLASLRRLYLDRCDLTPSGITALTRSDLLGRLETLELGFNLLDNQGARLLANSPRVGNLRQLGLAKTGINSIGVRALAQSRHLANVTDLDLSGNPLTAMAADSLADSPHLRPAARINLFNAAGLSDSAKQRLRERFGSRVVL